MTLKVFYSIRGLTLQNEKITGDDQSGDLRMLVMPAPVRLPSVSHLSVDTERVNSTRDEFTVHMYRGAGQAARM